MLESTDVKFTPERAQFLYNHLIVKEWGRHVRAVAMEKVGNSFNSNDSFFVNEGDEIVFESFDRSGGTGTNFSNGSIERIFIVTEDLHKFFFDFEKG